MSRLSDRLLVCVYVAIAIAPVVAMRLKVRDAPIFGALAKPPRPTPTFANFRREQFQPKFTAWFESALGFKGYAMRLDNSILYHVFGETKAGAPTRIGRDGVMFLHEDINYFSKHGADLPRAPDVDAMVDQIARVQARLARAGKALVPVIIPSKTSIYRDAVPPGWRMDVADPPPTDREVYDVFRRALEARGIRYVDARGLLAAPGVSRASVWGRQARHWSHYGACLVVREILNRRAELVGVRREHACELEMRLDPPEYYVDRDLAELINGWGIAPVPEGAAVVTHAGEPDRGPPVPTLIIGTSFGWTLSDDLVAARVGPIHVNFYNQTLFGPLTLGGDQPHEKVVPGSPSWRATTLDKELYILDLFETYLDGRPGLTTEFLSQLEAALP